MAVNMYRLAKLPKTIKTKTKDEKRKAMESPASNHQRPQEPIELTADQVMRQPDGKIGGKDIFKTFNEWATILDVPPEYNEHIAPNFTAGAIPLPEFKDVLAKYFSAQRKMKDADKIFPRQSRIEAIKDNLANQGDTPAPDNYNVSTAQWKFHNKTNFQYHPEDALWLEVGEKPYLFQFKDELYAPIPVKEQDRIKKHYSKQPIRFKIFLQAPVTSIEKSYIHYLAAHIYAKFDQHQPVWAHRGRDETFEQLKLGLSSSFPKALVAKFNEMCPACSSRVQTCREVGKRREESKKRKAEQEGQEVAPAKKTYNKSMAHSFTTQFQNQQLPTTSLQVGSHPQQYQPVPNYATIGGLTLPYTVQFPQHHGPTMSTGNQYQPPSHIGIAQTLQDQSKRLPAKIGKLWFPGELNLQSGNPITSTNYNIDPALLSQNSDSSQSTDFSGAQYMGNFSKIWDQSNSRQNFDAPQHPIDAEDQAMALRLIAGFHGIKKKADWSDWSELPPSAHNEVDPAAELTNQLYNQFSTDTMYPMSGTPGYAAPEQLFEASTADPDPNPPSSDPEQGDISLFDMENTYGDMWPYDDTNSLFDQNFDYDQYAADNSLP